MDIFKHKFIILASYSANALGQIRSLGENGIRPIAVLAHQSTYRIDKSKYISELFNVNSFERGLDLIINKFGKEKWKPFIFTDCDEVMRLLDTRFMEIKDKFYFWNAGSSNSLSQFMIKSIQLTIAKDCGMNIPNTEIVSVGELPKSLSYPIFTKATDSFSNIWWKANSYICNNEAELKDAYSKMDISSIVLQEYIIKQDEIPIEGISINEGKDIILFGQTRNYRMPENSYGTFRYVEKFKNKKIELQIKDFIQKVKYTGAFEVEFIIDKKGVPYFLEVNFRISQPNYAFTVWGANIPYIYAESILKNGITFNNNNCDQKPIKLMYEFEDFKYSILQKKISIFKWLKDVCSCDVFLYYNRHDKMPFYFTMYSKIILAIKKKIRSSLS